MTFWNGFFIFGLISLCVSNYVPVIGCRPGTFGFGCRSNCTCARGSSCDPITGDCPHGCPPDRWGVGCMLENGCNYNDDYGEHYMGGLDRTEDGKACQSWADQGAYDDDNFPDNNRSVAGNGCRNPDPVDFRTWCYYELGPKMKDRKWGYCALAQCECPPGRWGINCQEECHCRQEHEVCSRRRGTCISGCANNWTGLGCKECVDGKFGNSCDATCHCRDPDDVCDKVDGRCRSGCAPGWEGPSCQQEPGPVQNMVATPYSTSILLKWEPPFASNIAIKNYIVRHRLLTIADCNRNISGWYPIYSMPDDKTSFTLSGLNSYSEYMVNVWVVTEEHVKGQIETRNITTVAVAPSARIQKLILEELTATHITLAWEPPPCEQRNGKFSGYRVRLINGTRDYVGLLIDERVVNSTDLTIINKLIPNKTYTVSIAYINQVGAGPDENIHFRTLELKSGIGNKSAMTIGIAILGSCSIVVVISLIVCCIRSLLCKDRNKIILGKESYQQSAISLEDDYLVPVNPQRHTEREAVVPKISSEYITPLSTTNANATEEDPTLYMAPVIHHEPAGDGEYEQLNLYETIDI